MSRISAIAADVTRPVNINDCSLRHYRPDTVDTAPVLALIEEFLRNTEMAATRFGRTVMSDPRFVLDLRRGRRVTHRNAARVHAYLEGAV